MHVPKGEFGLTHDVALEEKSRIPTKTSAGKRALLCFDFDETLTATNSLHHLFVLKYHYYRAPLRYLWVMLFIVQIPVFFALYKIQTKTFNRFLYSRYRGMNVSVLQRIINTHLVPYISTRIYPQADTLLRSANGKNVDVIIVSASWACVVDAVAAKFDVTTCMATTLEEKNGLLTGRILELVDGEVKAKKINSYTADCEHAYRHTSVYGNSSGDIPMLNLACSAFVVNPNPRLSRWAKNNHVELVAWKVPRVYWSAWLFNLLVRPLVSSCEGFNNIPKSGGCIVIANHTSYVDHLVLYTLIAVKTRRRAKFVAKKEHFSNGVVAKILAYLGAYPIDRQTGGRGALESTIKLIENDEIVVVYPEGTRSRDGLMKAFKPGVVLIQKRTKCAIVPVVLRGAYHVLPPHKRLPRLGRVSVSFGQPIVNYGAAPKHETVPNEHRRKCQILEQTVAALA
ncbi:MAG: 1-acyl-sn-glycerol-3-phosphate acyltransferase [Flavobacteriales bacterium]